MRFKKAAQTFQGRQGSIVPDPLRSLDRVRLVKRLGAARPATPASTRQTMQAVFAA